MAGLPWEIGAFQPYHVGQYFTDGQGNTLQVYPDSSSPSGYVLKKIDASGNTTYQTGPTPNDPNAAAMAWETSPLGQRYAKYEQGLAEQNQFNNNRILDDIQIKKDTLKYQRDVAMMNARSDQERNDIDREYKQGLIRIAEGDLDVKRGQLDVSRGTLGLNTLQLGASLRGPRDLWAYDRAAGAANQNPLLRQAVSAWANMTNNSPTGLGAWGGGDPERMNLNALSADFGGPGGGVTPGSVSDMYGGGSSKSETLRALDAVARNPQQAAAGWFESMNPTQQQMTLGAWEELGHDPDTVMSRYRNTRINQGISGSRAA